MTRLNVSLAYRTLVKLFCATDEEWTVDLADTHNREDILDLYLVALRHLAPTLPCFDLIGKLLDTTSSAHYARVTPSTKSDGIATHPYFVLLILTSHSFPRCDIVRGPDFPRGNRWIPFSLRQYSRARRSSGERRAAK